MVESKVCEYCEKTFYRKNYTMKIWGEVKILPVSRFKNKLYCSNTCQTNMHRKRHPDVWKRINERFKKNNPNYSKERLQKIQKEKPEYYQKILNSKRDYYKENIELCRKQSVQSLHRRKKKIFEHYNNQCVMCGYKKVLDIHHLDEKVKRHKNDIKLTYRLLVLCPNCHCLNHRGLLSKQELLKHYKPFN